MCIVHTNLNANLDHTQLTTFEAFRVSRGQLNFIDYAVDSSDSIRQTNRSISVSDRNGSHLPLFEGEYQMNTQPLQYLTDNELVSLCSEDMEVGLTILLVERGSIILGGVRMRGIRLNPESSESLLADVLVFAWLNLHKFDPMKGSLNSWLIGVAYRKALTMHREKLYPISPIRATEIEHKPRSEYTYSSLVRSQEVRMFIHESSPRQRVVIRADIASPTGRGDTKELCAKLGCSRNALYDIRHRAYKKIKAQRKRFGL